VSGTGVVLDDDLDLLARDGVAVLLHVELDGAGNLPAGRLLRTGHRQDEADLDAVLSEGAGARQGAGGERRGGEKLSAVHRNFLRGLSDPVARTPFELDGMLGGFCPGRKPASAGPSGTGIRHWGQCAMMAAGLRIASERGRRCAKRSSA